MNNENKVRFGLTNVHYAPIVKTEDDKEVYGEFKRMRGAVELTLEPVGEQTPFYADNMAYHVFSSNAGYEGTLSIAEIPETFLTEILGEKKVDGILIEDINAKGKNFALAFEFDGDQKATRHVLYNCTASRPNISGATTEESVEAQVSELNFTAASNMKGQVRAKTGAETPTEIYNTWYEAPFVPEGQSDVPSKPEGEKEV